MSPSYSRRTFLHTSAVAGAALAGTPLLSRAVSASTTSSAKPTFPVADYHVHLSEHLSIEQAVDLGKQRGVQIGIVEHPGPGYKLNSDAPLSNISTLSANFPCVSACNRSTPAGRKHSPSLCSTNSITC